MALEINALKRVFRLKRGSNTLELDDPDSNLSLNEVMDFYSMNYPELTTATVQGPEIENDRAVYQFKTTIGVKIWQRNSKKKRRKNHANSSQNLKLRHWPV